MMMYARVVIARFGGVRPLARALNINSAATVFYWKRKGKIPRWRHDQIIKAAKREKVDITDVPELKAQLQ